MKPPIIMKTQPTAMQGLRPHRSVIVGLDGRISSRSCATFTSRNATYTTNMERMEPMVNMFVRRPRRFDLEASVPILSK